MNYIILLVIISSILYYFKKSDKNDIKNSTIPGPIVGNSLSMGGDHLHLQLFKWYKQYGSIYRLRINSKETIVLTGHKIIRKAFSQHSNILSNRCQFKSKINCNGSTIEWESGDRHSVLKNIIYDLNNNNGYKMKLDNLVNEELLKLISVLDRYSNDDQKIQINHYIQIYTLNVIIGFIFGFNKELQIDGIVKLVNQLSVASDTPIKMLSLVTIHWNNAPHSLFITYSLLAEEIKSLIKTYQLQRKDEIENGTFIQDSGSVFGKLIYEYERGNISMDAIADSILDMLIGSFKSSNTILFGLISLVNNQSIQSKLHSNILSSLTLSPSLLPSSEAIVINYNKYRSSIPYLTMVMKETFRKYPANALTVYQLTQDVEINYYKVSAGTQVIQNIYASHRSEEYFNNPDEFIPERFVESSSLPYAKDKGLIQFGINECIGKSIAESQIFTLFATLFNRYQFINPTPSIPLNDTGRLSISYQSPSTSFYIRKRLNNYNHN